ncbi:MAG: hypothetical protein KBD76_01160 [Bacteriovorax sp.]|nr:hypothetical protein [Bacteriovorax sp.]
MKTKSLSLVMLSIGVCSLAYAAEYKTPDVQLKLASPSKVVAKGVEFNEGYKVEEAAKTDRGIASEKDKESEREPSSIIAADKAKNPQNEKKDEAFGPKPWLYKTKLDSAY